LSQIAKDVKNGMFLDRDLFVLFWSQGSALDKPKVWSRLNKQTSF